MRRTALMRRSGPYRVLSRADGTLTVEPAWPQFHEYTDDEGGGPGLLSRAQLAHDIESYLNAVYPTGTTPIRRQG